MLRRAKSHWCPLGTEFVSMKQILFLFLTAGATLGSILRNDAYNRIDIDDGEMEMDDEIINDDMIKKCLETGDSVAFSKAKHARQKFIICGTSLLDTDRILSEIRAAMMGGGKELGPVIKRVCRLYQSYGYQCQENYLADLVPCLNDTNAEIETIMVKMSEASWSFLCENDAERAQMFLKNTTIACLESASPGILQCVAPYLPRLRAAGDPPHAVAQALVNKECSLVLSVANCIVSELYKCRDPVAANLIAQSLNESLSVSPCEEHRNSFQPQFDKEANLQTLLDAQSLQMVLINKVEELIKQTDENSESQWLKHKENQEVMKTILEDQSNTLEKFYYNVDREGKHRKL